MVNIEIENHETFDLIIVKGEIDASSSLELDNAFNAVSEGLPKKILVDLQGLEYISSAGLGVFISHLDDFKENHKHLILYGLSEQVFEVFRILGLEQIIAIVPSKEEALAI